jgi:hypothetical protein
MKIVGYLYIIILMRFVYKGIASFYLGKSPSREFLLFICRSVGFYTREKWGQIHYFIEFMYDFDFAK